MTFIFKYMVTKEMIAERVKDIANNEVSPERSGGHQFCHFLAYTNLRLGSFLAYTESAFGPIRLFPILLTSKNSNLILTCKRTLYVRNFLFNL